LSNSNLPLNRDLLQSQEDIS